MTKYLSLISITLALWSCSSYTPVAKDNFAYLYDRSVSTIHPQYTVYHVDENTTDLFYKISTSELLYQRLNSESPFEARVRFKYEAYESFASDRMLDSASVVVKDVAQSADEENVLIGKLVIKKIHVPSYYLKITATDLSRENQDIRVVAVERRTENNRQDFLVMDKRNVPLFSDHLEGNDTLRIKAEMQAGKKLYCRYYDREFRLPPPAFTGYEPAKFDYDADSLFELSINEEGNFDLITKSKGFYHLQTDTKNKEGLSLFILDQSFPTVSRVDDLLPPLRYITSLKEFDKINTDAERKKTIEEFWLKSAGSKERARDVIKAYYSRVENANFYFTSYIEGWRTDRGLIHIIFGMPNVIHKSEHSETWVYGEETNIMSLSFTFVKVQNPFTDNDFSLNRDPIYKTSWYRSVESWRNGRVYN